MTMNENESARCTKGKRKKTLLPIIILLIFVVISLFSALRTTSLWKENGGILISNVAENTVSSSRYSKQILDSETCGLTWTEFISRGNSLRGTTTTEPLVWSVSGGDAYRRYIKVLLDKWASLGVVILVIALDVDTATYVCKMGYDAVYWNLEERSYSRVADSKFQVAAEWAHRGIDQLFVELDVFCRQTPVPLLMNAAAAGNIDLATIGHGDLQQKINIGLFYVRASPATASFFTTVSDILLPSKENNTFIHGSRGVWQFFDQDVFHDCLQFAERQPAYYMPNDVNRTHNVIEVCNQFNLSTTMISNLHISSYQPPTVHDSTYCIHPLANKPFSSFESKLTTAKFLGFDPTSVSDDDRLLKTVSGDVVYSESWGAGFFANEFHLKHDKRLNFQYNIAFLIALARSSGRILVLPRHVRDKAAKAYPVFSLVSTASIGEIVPWRFMAEIEARALEHRTTVVEITRRANMSRATKNAVRNCANQVCAVHGLYVVEAKTFKEDSKELEDIIANLTWCFDFPGHHQTSFQFTTGAGGYERPCE